MIADKGFGELLQELREKKNVTLDLLGVGLRDAGKLSRVETGKVEAEKLLRDRLLARLGVAEENYENYLHYSEYKEWRERQDIVHSILHRNMEEAKQQLEAYKDGHSVEQSLEYQFYLSMLVQIRRIEGAGKEELRELFRQTLELTVPGDSVNEPTKLLLSVEELNLLLEYVFYSEEEFSAAWYEALFSYVEGLGLDKLTMAKIYPKLVFYYCRKRKIEETDKVELSRLLQLCNKAIEILQKGNRMFYLWELLQIKEQVLQGLICRNADKGETAVKRLKEWQQTCVNWYTTLEEVYEEYGVTKETQDFCYLYVDREAYCIGDVIRIRRKMFGMTMQQLCDGICSERTISRLERNETAPHRNIVRELFYRLKIPAEFCRTDLVTGNPEAIWLFGEAKRKSNQRKVDESDALLKQISTMVSFEIPGNRQAIRRIELSNEWNRRRKNGEKLDRQYSVEQLKGILEDTIPYEIAVAPGEKYLTQNEVSCLHNIMNDSEYTYSEMEQCTVALYDLYENQRRFEECFDMYEFVMGAIASNFGNKGEYDLSDEIGIKIIKNGLLYRRMRRIYKEKYSMLWNDVQRVKNQHPAKKGVDTKKELLNCIYLCEMCDNVHQLSFLEDAMKNGIDE